jgi:type VI secretion system protein ImpH
MATASWKPDPTLTFKIRASDLAKEDPEHIAKYAQLRELLEKEPYRVEFFQAVRLLERMEKGRGPVGYFLSPNMEVVRFSSLPTLAFAPSQLYDLNRGEDGQLRLVVQFAGILAAFTIMPHAYTEYALARLKDKDRAMAEFFDMFNHRWVSLFYRGWKKYRFYIGYEAGWQDGLTPRMMDMLGLGTAGLQDRSTLPDRAFLSQAGLLGKHVRTEASLRQILEDYFTVPVTIEQFAGTWRALPKENQSTMTGRNRASEMLGVGTVVGHEVWDNHGRIRVSLGPMPYETYVQFLPGNSAYKDLQSWIEFFSSGQYETEVQLILNKQEAPACELGLRGDNEPRLGLTSWLKTKPLMKNPGDAVFLLT